MTGMTDPTRPRERFRCPACGALMPFGARRCDACDEDAPVYNRPGFWLGLWISLGVIAAFSLWLLLRGAP